MYIILVVFHHPTLERFSGQVNDTFVNQGFTYPITDNQEEYKRTFVKIFSVPDSIDINTSKAQTPDKLQGHHSIHKAETKRDHDTPSRLDVVKNTHLSPCPSNSEHYSKNLIFCTCSS
jgi:hypothetical protein